MKGIFQFAANLLSYIYAKYYWNRSTSDLVIAKSRRVNFYLKHSVVVNLQTMHSSVAVFKLSLKTHLLNSSCVCDHQLALLWLFFDYGARYKCLLLLIYLLFSLAMCQW